MRIERLLDRAHRIERSLSIKPSLERQSALVQQHRETIRAARSGFGCGLQERCSRGRINCVVDHEMRREQLARVQAEQTAAVACQTVVPTLWPTLEAVAR